MTMRTPSVRHRPIVRRRLAAFAQHAASRGLALAVALALAACTGGGTDGTEAAAVTPPPTGPRAVDTPPPDYPLQFACAGVGGEVGLVVQIGTDGTLADVRVEYTSGRTELDSSAIAAVRTWRFKPATRRGEPVSTKIRVPVKFTPPPIKPDECFALEEAQRRSK